MENPIEIQISNITLSNCEALTNLIPAIEESKKFGTLAGGQKIAENFSVMHYIEKTQIVEEFIAVSYANNFILKFDWMKWKVGEQLLEDTNTNYSNLDLATICKLITALVRNDRFCEGYLVSCFEKGIILKILYSLRKHEMAVNKIYLKEILPLDKLSNEGKILLIRHQHNNLKDLVELDLIEEFQSFQDKKAFKECKILVAFLAEPNNQAKFFGLYRKTDLKEKEELPMYSNQLVKYAKPLNKDADFYLNLAKDSEFEKYKNRIVIDWKVRLWYNIYDTNTNKEVVKVLPKNFVMELPDLMKIVLTHFELKSIIDNPDSHSKWHESLSHLQAVYLIFDKLTRKQYVGNTLGQEGLWNRWRNYVTGDYTGGNVKLLELKSYNPDFYRTFQFTILEILSKTATKEECYEAESSWMTKLGTKADGLN